MAEHIAQGDLAGDPRRQHVELRGDIRDPAVPGDDAILDYAGHDGRGDWFRHRRQLKDSAGADRRVTTLLSRAEALQVGCLIGVDDGNRHTWDLGAFEGLVGEIVELSEGRRYALRRPPAHRRCWALSRMWRPAPEPMISSRLVRQHRTRPCLGGCWPGA